MIHIKRNICLVAVSCTLLAGIPLQGVAQTGRTAKVQTTQSNKITVSGTVLDKTTNDPLIGVSVVVKGVANAGTITDMDGKFTLKLPYAEAPLVFSYLGYQPQEIVPGAKKELTVLLQEDTKALQEVVVVGYTKQRKETMIGSVATITTKDLTQSPTANINNALAGRLPGLIVNQYAGGEPGVDQSELFIRGKATYGNQSAIVIVDGIERDMSYLAPDEIETFTILKDASATAAYGIRGANGVIVITTKRGKAAEKATVNLKASIGINQPIGFPEYLGSADYATLYNEARLNDAKMTGADIS
ncbi:MAG: carboxypeptidase-like regulatory domain-containing protein, partial [Bacteroides ovatus]|nr:carboxypeptidase-like regulatory domain-containing protein [Bacteroides ovatus]